MAKGEGPRFELRTVEELKIEDESSFRHVELYAELKDVLRRHRYPFRILPGKSAGRWDRALFLNLTYWGADAGGDVLTSEYVPADVVAHAAWHHLSTLAFPSAAKRPSADALFLGESIASAFDLYLVGRLMGKAPESSFLETQVPAMAEAADEAGLREDEFESLLQMIADDPDRAFEDLRQLLFDATTGLALARDADEALAVLERCEAHRFGSLLHRYELSNWVLYARAFGALDADPAVRAVDDALRRAPVSLEWLTSVWVAPALAG